VGKVNCPVVLISGDEVLSDIMKSFPSENTGAAGVVTASELPDMLISETLYHQILANLVGNALHYAGGKPVEVSGERKGSVVRLLVRDHGCGVPDEEKLQIFEPFYRGAKGRKLTGTGVGLAIVQKIARIHEGSAWVEDAPGGGSLFIVELKGV